MSDCDQSRKWKESHDSSEPLIENKLFLSPTDLYHTASLLAEPPARVEDVRENRHLSVSAFLR